MLTLPDFDKNVATFRQNRKMTKMLLATEEDGDGNEVDKRLIAAGSKYENSKKKESQENSLEDDKYVNNLVAVLNKDDDHST